jgi:hypothetical protein
MKTTGILRSIVVSITLFVVALFAPTRAFAHCDGMDGPVVKAARKALETGNVNAVLIWVQKKDEDEVREAFKKVLTVRKLSPEAAALTDMYFFETVVRLHRGGEGAPYTGLKPAGRDLGPAIPAADRALESGSAEPLLKLLTESVQEGIHEHFEDAVAKKDFSKDDIEAGRAYVKAYVEYVHYVERLYEAAQNPVHGHFHESEEASMQAAEN